MREQIWHLRTCKVFSSLSADELVELERHCRSRKFLRGEMINLSGNGREYVFFLSKGVVKLSQITEEGKESILGFISPGELFGEMALIDRESTSELMSAVEECQIMMVPTPYIRRLMSRNADLAFEVTKVMGVRRFRIEMRLKNILFVSNRDRLIHLLLDLAEQFGVVRDSAVLLSIRLSHQELANLIGSTRETVTILIGQLQAEGMIEAGRMKMKLNSPARLASCVHRAVPSIASRVPQGRVMSPAFA